MLHAHVDQVDADVGRTAQLLPQPGGGLFGPGHAGQVGEEVDLPPRKFAGLQKPRRVDQHGGQRPHVSRRLQPLDAVLRRSQVDLERCRGQPRIEHGHLAVMGQAGDQREGQILGLLQPRVVLVAVLHPLRGVENQRRGDRRLLRPPARPQLDARPRQGQRQQGDRQHPQGQQQQVPQPQPAAVGVLPQLHEPQGRKLEVLGLAAHHQVQHDRQCNESGAVEE